jgi:pyruvate,water dikinase
MAVIIQRLLDADVSGVMFTDPNGPTLIEASWGLGPSVVEGRVTPDRYQVTTDGTVTRTIADKLTSLDRQGSALTVRRVPTAQRRTPTLSDATAVQLAALAQRVTTLLGSPQDIEWSLTANTPWLLQSRPNTTQPPTLTAPTPRADPAPLTGDRRARQLLIGIPGSHGTATGPARIVRGPADFPNVGPGDILICPFTDPALVHSRRRHHRTRRPPVPRRHSRPRTRHPRSPGRPSSHNPNPHQHPNHPQRHHRHHPPLTTPSAATSGDRGHRALR